MITRSVKITLYVPCCHSLKEKRMICRGLLAKIQNKFNVSAAEVDFQDFHQTICLGLAVVSQSQVQAQKVLDEVVRFIESQGTAEIIGVVFE